MKVPLSQLAELTRGVLVGDPNCVIEKTAPLHTADSLSITFAEKPEREVLNALRGAGFYWHGGCWHGKAEAVPECVRELL